MKKQPKKGQSGYSLMEVTVALAVTTALMIIIFSMIEEAMTLSLFIESHNDLTTMSQKAMNSIQTEILQARQIFAEDGAQTGTKYRQKIEALLPACAYPCASNNWSLPVVAGTQLPAVDPALTLAPDPAGNRYTGNALLIARQLPPVSISIIADPVNPGGFPAFTFNADRYRFEYFYLTWHGSPSHRSFRDGDHVVDLWRVYTIEYADYYQLANATVNMSPAQQQDLSTKIRTSTAYPHNVITTTEFGIVKDYIPNLQVAWNPQQPYDTAFWTIDTNLAFPVANQINNYNLTLASGGSLLPALLTGRIGGRMDYTVGYLKTRDADPAVRLLKGVPLNDALTDARNPLPEYARVAASLPIDCGFEVKIVGQPGSRQILTRLVMYSNYRASKLDSTEAFVISSFTRT